MNSHANADLYNLLIDELKDLNIAIEYFEKFEVEKDLKAREVAKDSISERVRRIDLRISNNHQMTFPTKELVELLSQPKYTAKQIREVLDFPIESLRKFALSEILRESITE